MSHIIHLIQQCFHSSRLNIVITHGSNTNGSTNCSINHLMSELRNEIEMGILREKAVNTSKRIAIVRRIVDGRCRNLEWLVACCGWCPRPLPLAVRVQHPHASGWPGGKRWALAGDCRMRAAELHRAAGVRARPRGVPAGGASPP